MFNKTLLRNTFVLPPYTAATADGTGLASVCVLKSTATSKNPLVITDPTAKGSDGKPLYGPQDIVTIITKTSPNSANVYQYTYTVRAYVQSYNFLRILGGLGNVVFSS